MSGSAIAASFNRSTHHLVPDGSMDVAGGVDERTGVCGVDRWRAEGSNRLIARGWVCLPARRSHPLHLSAVCVAVDENHPNVRLSLRDTERSQNTVTQRRSPQFWSADDLQMGMV